MFLCLEALVRISTEANIGGLHVGSIEMDIIHIGMLRICVPNLHDVKALLGADAESDNAIGLGLGDE